MNIFESIIKFPEIKLVNLEVVVSTLLMLSYFEKSLMTGVLELLIHLPWQS